MYDDLLTGMAPRPPPPRHPPPDSPEAPHRGSPFSNHPRKLPEPGGGGGGNRRPVPAPPPAASKPAITQPPPGVIGGAELLAKLNALVGHSNPPSSQTDMPPKPQVPRREVGRFRDPPAPPDDNEGWPPKPGAKPLPPQPPEPDEKPDHQTTGK